MKTFFVTISFCLIIILIIYTIPEYRQGFIKLLSYSECDTPIVYKLGSIDVRFGLSKNDVLQDISQSVGLWNNTEGKLLFAYSNSADLTVNFIYDQRQELTNSINSLNKSLSQSNNTIKEQIINYQDQLSMYKQQINSFNNTINEYNNRGGAPADVYQKLKDEENQLKLEGERLNSWAKQLNLSTYNYNSNVNTLNQEVDQFNADLLKKPEEGLFNGGNSTITIYFSNNHDELIHTLAHEFGHALGMVHTGDSSGIMYPYTTSNLNISAQDKNQLDYICRQKFIAERLINLIPKK